MNTEEAIKNVEDIYNCHESDRSCSDVETEIIFKNRDKIIKLLQQGEKYKDIFETIVEWSTGDTITYNDLVDLEQKYFPKELPDEKTTKL